MNVGQRFCLVSVLACSTSCWGGQAAASNPPAPTETAPAPVAAQTKPRETRVDAQPRDYLDAKIAAMFKDHHATNGFFKFSVVPLTPELWIAGEYPKWTEKRLSDEQIGETVEGHKPIFDNSMLAILSIIYMGDVFSQGRVQFEVPGDICEYIFLENDRGESIPCSRATLPLMRMAGPFTKTVNVELEFANLKSAPAKFFDTKTLTFVVGGLDFKHNTITYPSPLSILFGDAPDPLKDLYRATGIWPG